MRKWLGILAVAVSGVAGAQPLLDFPDNLAFKREAVESFAERGYRRNLGEIEKAGRLDRDPALNARLQPIVKRLIAMATSERPGADRMPWELHTCRQCGETASALAGGKMLVGEEFVANHSLTDDELAFVVAHEMGHVLAEHTREFATVARYFLDQGLRREYWDIQRELDTASMRRSTRSAYRSSELEAATRLHSRRACGLRTGDAHPLTPRSSAFPGCVAFGTSGAPALARADHVASARASSTPR